MKIDDCKPLFDKLRASYPFDSASVFFMISFCITDLEIQKQDSIEQVKQIMRQRALAAADFFISQLDTPQNNAA